MGKVALITGITGQDGSYLAEFLLSKGYKVYGLIRRSSTINFERLDQLQDKIELIPGDLLDQNSLISALKQSQPQEVYNPGVTIFRTYVVEPTSAYGRIYRSWGNPNAGSGSGG